MKTYGIVIAGQSNEQGGAVYTNGGQAVSFTSPFGFPNNDLLGNGSEGCNGWSGRASVWPLLSQLLAARNIRACFLNAAVSGTGMVHNWAGYILPWSTDVSAANMLGAWVLPHTANGHKYKCTSVGNTGSTEPAWGTTNGGTTTESVSGGAVWTCYATDSNDVGGHVYASGQSGYDPNGYIAALKTRIGALPAGLDQYWVFIAGNQSDLITGSHYVTSTLRATALINLIGDLLATFPTLNIAPGMTSYWNSGYESANPPVSYEAVLEPSNASALAYFAGNPRVFAGGDLFVGLGKSPVYSGGDSPSNIHIGPESTIAAAKIWRDALVATGIF
jgi:hypothetical protein